MNAYIAMYANIGTFGVVQIIVFHSKMTAISKIILEDYLKLFHKHAIILNRTNNQWNNR